VLSNLAQKLRPFATSKVNVPFLFVSGQRPQRISHIKSIGNKVYFDVLADTNDNITSVGDSHQGYKNCYHEYEKE